MEIRLFDKVLLKDGRKGDVVEVFEGGYIVDVELGSDYDTISITIEDVQSVLNKK